MQISEIPRSSTQSKVAVLQGQNVALMIVVCDLLNQMPPVKRASVIDSIERAMKTGFGADAPLYEDPDLKDAYKGAVTTMFQYIRQSVTH